MLTRLNPRKAKGPDDIPSAILKDNAVVLSVPLCSVINASIEQGIVPDIWKSADVCPLPKVSPPVNLDKDFRPISLTPVIAKIAEKCVKPWIMEFIENDLDPYQFGSLSGSSTTLALIELYHLWINALETPGTIIRILLLDFRKAFDLVDHKIVLRKLANTGMPDYLVRWITSFLCQRQQRVKIGGDCHSEWSFINAGVPQGTILGPVCFLLHINDLRTICDCSKYVDDSSIWEACLKDCSDSKLQTAANQAAQWSESNNMQLNCDKTKELVVNFTRSKKIVPPIDINGSSIERVHCAKLLGVLFSNDLTWEEHTQYICGKSAKRLYFLRLLKRAGVLQSEITAVYSSIVRSVLEYACELWHPGLTKEQSMKIERIQKRALRIIYPDLDYSDALVESKLQSLETRREQACNKLFVDMCKTTHKLHRLIPDVKTSTYELRNPNMLAKPKLRTLRAERSLINYGLLHFQ